MTATFVSHRTKALLLIAFAGALALTGCGDGGTAEPQSVTQPPPPPPPPTNRAPLIAGSPNGSVMVGNAYSFTPTASDPDGDALTFSITGKPSWATFNTSTGKLSGTPGAGDVGTSSSITISVSDGTDTTSLASFTIQVVAVSTGSATLTWTPPTTNTDGSPLILSGYRVYWGTTQGSYSNSVTLTNGGLSSYVVDQLTPATWYFVVTAISSTGSESVYSNVASKVVL